MNLSILIDSVFDLFCFSCAHKYIFSHKYGTATVLNLVLPTSSIKFSILNLVSADGGGSNLYGGFLIERSIGIRV